MDASAYHGEGMNLQTELEIEPAVLRFGGTALLRLFHDKELHITVPAHQTFKQVARKQWIAQHRQRGFSRQLY